MFSLTHFVVGGGGGGVQVVTLRFSLSEADIESPSVNDVKLHFESLVASIVPPSVPPKHFKVSSVSLE